MSVTDVDTAPATASDDTSRLTLLYQAAEEVNSTLELNECLDRIIDGAYKMFQAEKVSLMLLDEEAGEMRICAARNVPPEVMAEAVVRLGEGLSGRVAESGQPLVVTDLEDDPRVQRKEKRQYRTGSFAIMPLKHRDRVLGVLNLTNRSDGTVFSDADIALLTALSNQAAIAIANARLVAQLSREKEQLNRSAFESTILYRVSSSIQYGLGFQHLISLLSSSLHELVDYDVFASLLVLEGDEEFGTQVRHDTPQAYLADTSRRLLDRLEARPHGPLVAKRTAALREGLPAPGADRVGSVIGVPLEVNDQAVGMICIGSRRPDAFSAEDAELLNTIVSQMAGTVQRLQDTIRGEQDKMQSMVASMAEGVLMFDANDQLVVLNQRARSMLGLPARQEFTTRGLFESIAWNDIAAYLARPAEDHPASTEFTVDGQTDPVTLAVTVTPVVNDRAERLGRVAVIRDITRQRELDRMKSDFVAIVSHELRTPLASIKMFTSNLLDGVEGEINDGQRDTLARMAKNLDRLSRLINDLLDLSKLEAGKMQMKLAPVDVTRLLHATADSFAAVTADKRVVLDIQAPDDLPVVWADPDRIEQVATNLVGNAMKFAPEEGRVTVKAWRRRPDPAEQIGPTGKRSPLSGEAYVAVSVADTGPGIPPDDIDHVFDKFYQADHSMGRKTGGTGLGLPICKEIIAKHGGRIWAESEPGRGATFTFDLPADGRAHDRAPLRSALEREIRRSRRYGVPFSLLMLDIDDFTQLNQQYGYPSGDTALIECQDIIRAEVKKFLKRRIRETDVVGRFGGDEFLVIAPETDWAGAVAFAERLRRLVEARRFAVDDKEIAATVSIGVTTFEEDDLAPMPLIRRVASALSQAKTQGKNQVQ